ncbi:hypothetical protein ACOSQ3_024488 [Xanthoceras sorbifolium]
MATAQRIIDLQNGKLSMTVLGETVEFQLERAIEEEQRLSNTGAEDPKTGFGVNKNSKRKNKPKPCPNKSLYTKPKSDEKGGKYKLQLLLLGYLNPRKRELSMHERITGHAADGVLDVR